MFELPSDKNKKEFKLTYSYAKSKLDKSSLVKLKSGLITYNKIFVSIEDNRVITITSTVSVVYYSSTISFRNKFNFTICYIQVFSERHDKSTYKSSVIFTSKRCPLVLFPEPVPVSLQNICHQMDLKSLYPEPTLFSLLIPNLLFHFLLY